MKNRYLVLVNKALGEWGKTLDDSVDEFLANPSIKESEIKTKEKIARKNLISRLDDYIIMENFK